VDTADLDIAAWITAHAIELVGVAFGLAGVWLTAKQNVWCWPIGLVNVICFLFMFVRARLYADAALQVVYVVLSIYGWYSWSRPKAELPVIRYTPMAWAVSAGILVAGALGVGFVLSRTDAALPWVNATTAVASLIAQYMMTRKVLDSWAVWIVADVVMIRVYLHQQLYFTAGLYVVFIVLCVSGWIEWKRSMGRAVPAMA
jgi:nicotinamide mononucleotide transporter